MGKAKTRISLHTSNKKPVSGEEVTFAGYLQVYDSDEKRWDPLRGKLMLFVDGEKVKEFSSNNYGYFEVEHSFKIPKKYDVEVRYEGSAKAKACMAGMRVEVLTEEQKSKIGKVVRIFLVFVLFILLLAFLLSLYLSLSFTPLQLALQLLYASLFPSLPF